MGIQALTEYGSMFTGALDLDIDVTAGYNFSHSFNVQTTDAMVLKTVRVGILGQPQLLLFHSLR